MPIILAEDLIEEIKIAIDIIENHHVNCEWMVEPDLNAEETESCDEFQEIFGKGYDRLVCHDHEKLREWSKLIRDIASNEVKLAAKVRSYEESKE